MEKASLEASVAVQKRRSLITSGDTNPIRVSLHNMKWRVHHALTKVNVGKGSAVPQEARESHWHLENRDARHRF
jgi:hypothetical protein